MLLPSVLKPSLVNAGSFVHMVNDSYLASKVNPLIQPEPGVCVVELIPGEPGRVQLYVGPRLWIVTSPFVMVELLLGTCVQFF